MILKIEKINGEDVLIIPPELLQKWNIKQDQKYSIHYENGGLILIPEKDVSGESN
jgi:antitoxin component of MazEF toxin-antitoxin module